MKLAEFVHPQHQNISTWLSKAIALSTSDIIEILHDESQRDPVWFVRMRERRLRQLIAEILTLKLHEVSNRQWDEHDFEGHTNSDLISSAINTIFSKVDTEYHRIQDKLRQPNKEEAMPQHLAIPGKEESHK